MEVFSAEHGSREEGFTLVELLVVILIIGILAAIAIPSFLNQREKGQDTCAKTVVRTMSLAMESYYTEQNSYSNATIGALNLIEPTITSGGACGNDTGARTGLAVAADGGCDTNGSTVDSFCVSQSSGSGGATRTQFSISKAPGTAMVRTCGPANRHGHAGCPAGGTW
jgi:type IV pilus assembly protein PilA